MDQFFKDDLEIESRLGETRGDLLDLVSLHAICPAFGGEHGAQDYGPFDGIVISTPSVPCDPLLAQLSTGGVLLCLEHGRNSLSLLARYTKQPDGEIDREIIEMVDFSNSQNEALSELGVISLGDPTEAQLPELGGMDKLLKRLQPELFNACSRAFLDHNHIVPSR